MVDIFAFNPALGMSVFVFALIILWSGVWKLIALWKAGRNNHLAWFIVMGILNTAGILPILYIFWFSKIGKKKSSKKK